MSPRKGKRGTPLGGTVLEAEIFEATRGIFDRYLRMCKGSRTDTANALGVCFNTLRNWLRRLGIDDAPDRIKLEYGIRRRGASRSTPIEPPVEILGRSAVDGAALTPRPSGLFSLAPLVATAAVSAAAVIVEQNAASEANEVEADEPYDGPDAA